jgi:DNA-directed RNA polymerase subunit RPC12/RpoP
MKHIISENDFVICKECNEKLQKIDGQHLLKAHPGITLDNYQIKYPNEPTISKKEFNRLYGGKLNQFLNKFNEYNIEFKDLKFENVRDEYLWKCKKCDHEFKQNFNSIDQGYLCPSCNFKFTTKTIHNGTHNIKDIEYVICPYCKEFKKLQFVHQNHLRLVHNKTLADLQKDFLDYPTMTLKESQKISQKRKDCNYKVVKTCEEKYGGVGYKSKELDKLPTKEELIMKINEKISP